MKFRHTTHNEYFQHLKAGHEITKNIYFLLKGEYSYNLAIKNPYQQVFVLIVLIKSGKTKLGEYKIESSEIIIDKEITLNQIVDHFKSPIQISFYLQSGSDIEIYLPVSAVLITSVEKEDTGFERISAQVKAAFKEPVLARQDLSLPTHPVKQYPQTDLFRDCLTWADAEKQLEYVVYYKTFMPDGSKGFKKWKRSFYRKLLIGLYRRISKNTIRKRYIAKLYRNYVNSNTIFENMEKA